MFVARLLFLFDLRHLFEITLNSFSVSVAFIALSLFMIFLFDFEINFIVNN